MDASASQSPSAEADTRPPALWRRLAAAFYDGLVVLGIFILATFLIVPFFPHARNLDSFYADHPAIKFVYQLVLLALAFAFFGGFWTRNGQTLGMLAWKLRVVQSANGARVTWRQALVRYLAALVSWVVFGLGFIWSLFDRDRKTWHDRLSGTELRMARSFAQLSNEKPESGRAR
ncbi:MAG TPA: RDD family protein [Gammaproteobacteria bacterium]|nr:RDD family protein [Gammaproteobacteria bacterium]